MTNEEAIERINEHIAIHRYNEPQAIRIAEALQMGIDALEKQIPKKPIKPGPLLLFYKCPICKNSVDDYGRYCIVCGQKLDWSEDEQ